MLRVVSCHGYGSAKVGDIATQANVSRATFYELFADKQACFTAAHQLLARRVAGDLEAAIAAAEPADAVHAALAAIARLAETEPAVLRFLTHEALLAGHEARSEYEALMARLQHAVEAALLRPGHGERAPTVPVRVLLGGATRLYCMQARRRAGASGETLPSLLRWADSYRSAGQLPDWTSLEPSHASVCKLRPARRSSPRLLPRGRHRLAKDVVDAIQRERIAYATAQAVMDHDSTSVAVADIVAAAGVSREVFYTYFADKQQAFLAAHQLIFEQLMAVSSSAFFMPDIPWPERVWDAAWAFAGLLAANPSFAHFAFIAAYSIGETGVRRVDETSLAFGLFLEEGYARPEAQGLSRVTSDAIALGVIEEAAHYVRNDRTTELPALVPTVTYTALAPFIGPAAAQALIGSKLSAY